VLPAALAADTLGVVAVATTYGVLRTEDENGTFGARAPSFVPVLFRFSLLFFYPSSSVGIAYLHVRLVLCEEAMCLENSKQELPSPHLKNVDAQGGKMVIRRLEGEDAANCNGSTIAPRHGKVPQSGTAILNCRQSSVEHGAKFSPYHRVLAVS
jgi:hypothetical protein